MAVRRIAGYEDTARAIGIGNGEAQLPEADVVDLDIEFCACRLAHELPEIEVVLRGAGRHRGVEEPGAVQVHTAEELPVSLELGMQHAVERLARIALQQAMQFMR